MATKRTASVPASHPVPAFREALDRARPTLDDFAAAVGVPRGTLTQYHNGNRRPPAEVCRKVAQMLRAQSADLSALAEELEAEAQSEVQPV